MTSPFAPFPACLSPDLAWLTGGRAGNAAPTAPRASALNFDAEKLQAVQQRYLADSQAIWRGTPNAGSDSPPDRRFASPEWQRQSWSAQVSAGYLAVSRAMLGLAEALQGDPKQCQRVRFAVQQWLDAMAPSNFLAGNPEAIQKALQTQGASLRQGLDNLLRDLRQGHLSQTDEQAFEVGRNLAITPGAVVFENALFQLIEYQPQTPKVQQRPLLIVPPCINKYYILDLQPDNSLVRHAVEQGVRTFIISWRNPDATLAQASWDDYVEQAVIEAIAVTRSISGQDGPDGQINALGFCVGGTLLATALAVLAARGNKPVASLTLLTTFLEFSDTGVLDLFVDEDAVRLRELQLGQGGLLDGRELAATFSFLRPNELVWNYVVGNYLKGETPAPFDLLYWNSDATNLPGPFYAWYLRHTYLANDLAQPGKVRVCGEAVDFGRLDMPAYVYGSREDHIVPIGSAYASTGLLKGPQRFVMGASGHIAGVINPPARHKRSYRVDPAGTGSLPAQWAQWLARSTEHAGSWWPDWSAWLAEHGGDWVAAPRRLGNRRYPVIEPAPGRYVKAGV